MASNQWMKALNVVNSANRFWLVGGADQRRAQVALMAALAIRPQEARTREWEVQIPADVDAPMRRLDEVLAQMRPQDALTRGQQASDLWDFLPGGPF